MSRLACVGWPSAFALLLAAAVPAVPAVHAHDLRPGAVALQQTADGVFRLAITPPEDGGALPVVVEPLWPDGCARLDNTLTCKADLKGPIVIPGLARRRAKLLVHVQWLADAKGGAPRWQRLLREGETTAAVPDRSAAISQQGDTQLAWPQWLGLGVEHILLGPDHLLFVLGLALVAGWHKRLLGAVTAFTLAHSLTLAGAGLGFVVAPGAAAELVIAASVLLLAAEAARAAGGAEGVTATQRWPAAVALLFGLVHGFGFAGAIAELGLPQDGRLAALLAFNAGIELGQVAVLLLAGGLVWLAQRGIGAARSAALWPRVRRGLAYSIGAVAGIWTVDRGAQWLAQLGG